MSWLSSLFHGPKNPADSAMPYYNKIPGEIKPYYDPYINQGNQAYNSLNPQLSSMTNDPAAFLEKIMGSYEPSRAYQLQRDEASRAAGNTAAAGGMRGSLSDITNQSRLADTLLGNDMQNWLTRVLGIENKGLEGMSHIYDTGYNASNNLAGDLANVLGTQGTLAFQGQANQNQADADRLSGILKALGGIAGFGLPGGGTIGSSALHGLGFLK